jgi:uncharacterized protein involved in type VI secretion and phage assembly
MINDFTPDGGRQTYYGLYPALVTDLVDPDGLGRIEVELPWLGEGSDRVRAWATLLSPYADDAQGFQALPEAGSQVVVGFEAGNPRRPYIVGACWNGRESLPSEPQAANNIRVLKTRSGSKVEFDDTEGAARIIIETAGGHRIELDDAGPAVSIRHSMGSSINFTAGGSIEITANATVELTAATFNVHAGVANFDGMINCTTLTASVGVVSPMYTPGAGNIW